MKKMYGINMEKEQYPKLMEENPLCDIYISMGCNVTCPIVKGAENYNWGIEDPSVKSDEEFVKTIKKIEEKVLSLKRDLTI